jgi:hypothetical protein
MHEIKKKITKFSQTESSGRNFRYLKIQYLRSAVRVTIRKIAFENFYKTLS